MSQEVRLGQLEIRLDSEEDRVVYLFNGSVDEEFARDEIPAPGRKKVILNLAGVTSFNSCGIREWVFWTQELSQGSSLCFLDCSIPMIDQINMIPQSLGNGKIESFYAPYFCDTCGEVNKLIKMSEHGNMIENKKAPQFSCDTCGSRLAFDSMESSYFLFVDHQKNCTQAS